MVYVVQNPQPRRMPDGRMVTINLAPAAKFGEFKVLLPDGDVILSTIPSIDQLRRGLANFSDEDYLLLIGDPVAIGLAVAVAAEKNRGKVRILRWLKTENDYMVITADFRPAKFRD